MRRSFMSWLHGRSVRSVPLLILVLALVSGSRSVAGQGQLSASDEILDGTVVDIAAQRANGNDMDKRAWLAQGRVRKAIRIVDRKWMHDEDESFDLVFQNYPTNAPSKVERIVAVEVNEDRIDGKDYLYTLTESALYRQDITVDPKNPGPPVWIPLMDACEPPPPPLTCPTTEFDNGEQMVDFKVWNHPTNAESGKIFLLTGSRVVVLKDKTAAITYKSSADELLTSASGKLVWTSEPVDTWFNQLGVRAFLFLEIAGEGKYQRAYIGAETENRALPKNRNGHILIGCDLNSDGVGFLKPTFDADPDPDYESFEYWDPFTQADHLVPPGSTIDNDDYAIYDVGMARDGPLTVFAYAACGQFNQVQRVDVTHWFSTGLPGFPTEGYELFPQPAVPNHGKDHVRNVVVDPGAPDRFLAMSERAFYVGVTQEWPANPLAVLRSTVNEPNARKGLSLDIAYVPGMAGGVDAVWTAGSGKVDHVCKVVDVTAANDPVLPNVDLVDEYFALSSSDGGVYVDGEVYLPTFGGVVRYTYNTTAQRWEAVDGTYQPAEQGGPGSGIARNTEDIGWGELSTVPLDRRVFTTPADGGFMEFPIRLDKDLDPNQYIPPDTSKLPNAEGALGITNWISNWDINGIWPQGMYGNNVAFVVIGSTPWVLVTLTDFDLWSPEPGTTNVKDERYTNHALLAYRWDTGLSEWVHEASAAGSPIQYPNNKPTTTARLVEGLSIAPGAGADEYFAFMGHKDGFYSVDLTGLIAVPYTLSVASEVFPVPNVVGTNSTFADHVSSLVANEDRLFVWVADGNAGSTIRIYEWNRSNGVVTVPEVKKYELDNPPPGFVPFNPGTTHRARFHRTVEPAGDGYLVFANSGVSVFRFSWSSASPSALGNADVWTSDYGDIGYTDCRVYDMSPIYGTTNPYKILAVKNNEAFSVLDM